MKPRRHSLRDLQRIAGYVAEDHGQIAAVGHALHGAGVMPLLCGTYTLVRYFLIVAEVVDWATLAIILDTLWRWLSAAYKGVLRPIARRLMPFVLIVAVVHLFSVIARLIIDALLGLRFWVTALSYACNLAGIPPKEPDLSAIEIAATMATAVLAWRRLTATVLARLLSLLRRALQSVFG